MPRETETYRATVQMLNEKAEKNGINAMMITVPSAAILLGLCDKTVRKKEKLLGFVKEPGGLKFTTIPKLARYLSREN